MPEPLFTSVAGFPCGLLPYDASGKARESDGRNVLNLEQASARWNVDDAALRLLWSSTWEELMTPNAGGGAASNDEVIETIRGDAQLVAFRRVNMPDISEAEFAGYVAACRSKGLDPLDRPLYPFRKTFEDGSRKLEFRYTMPTMRELAHRTDRFAGIDEPKLVFSEDERNPYRASVTVYRRDAGGNRSPYTGHATWDEYYPASGTTADRAFWDRMPTLKLSYCAEAVALRKAFPGELRGIYTVDEMAAASAEGGVARRSAGGPPGEGWDDRRQRPWPTSLFEFSLALAECGIAEARRSQVIAELRRDAGAKADSDEQFYRLALQRVYADPVKYGAKGFDAAAG